MKVNASISANICHLLLCLLKSHAYLHFLEFCSSHEPKWLGEGPKATYCLQGFLAWFKMSEC